MAKCPSCGDKNAYVGFSCIECPNPVCEHWDGIEYYREGETLYGPEEGDGFCDDCGQYIGAMPHWCNGGWGP